MPPEMVDVGKLPEGSKEDDDVKPPETAELPVIVGPAVAEPLPVGYGAEVEREELIPPDTLEVRKPPELPGTVGPAVIEVL
jgi:hypothetical protein